MQTLTLASSSRPLARAPRALSHELEAELGFVTRLVADEPAAWREFNLRYAATLHRNIGRVIARFGAVSSSDDVREIYAKLCLSLLARDKLKLRSFDPARGARLSSWLVRLALQATYDHLRRIKRSPVDARVEPHDVADDVPDAFAQVWEHERARLVTAALERLSPREREFFKLYFGEGLEPEAIAERMGISVATVYTKRHKLEKRLLELLDEQRMAA